MCVSGLCVIQCEQPAPTLQCVIVYMPGAFRGLCSTLQVQKEAATKEYANTRYDQPYQAALYENSVLLEAQRWHTEEYEKVIGGLEPADLEVCAHSILLDVAQHMTLHSDRCGGQGSVVRP